METKDKIDSPESKNSVRTSVRERLAKSEFNNALWEVAAAQLGKIPKEKPSKGAMEVLLWLSLPGAPQIKRIRTIKKAYRDYVQFCLKQKFKPLLIVDFVMHWQNNQDAIKGVLVNGKGKPPTEAIVIDFVNPG